MRHALPIETTWDGAPALAAERVQTWLERAPTGLLFSLDAPLHGDPPPQAPPGPTWALWEHEVVELFVLGAGEGRGEGEGGREGAGGSEGGREGGSDGGGERYTELELGPHGHHLLLRLEGVRRVVERMLPLDVHFSRSFGRWQARALLPWALLPAPPWRANAFAIHGLGPSRRYLAAFPTGGAQPDFHRLEVFRPLPAALADPAGRG